jgi:hypothetical protein
MMGWFVKEPELDPGERVVTTKAANRAQGRRSVGGRLTVTDRRLIFMPNLVDSILAGRSWSVAKGDVAGVGEAAGMRKRLRVRTNDGGEELFLVKGLEEFVSQLIQQALPPEQAA